MSSKLTVCDHPLVQDKLSRMRDRSTPPMEFRSLMNEVAMLMSYQLLHGVRTRKARVRTPLKVASCRLLDQPIACIAILRAGLGLTEGIAKVCPEARFGHIGIYRNEASLEPVRYYVRLPDDLRSSFVVLADPMIATGGSAVEAIEILKSAGAKTIHLVALIAAKAGIDRVTSRHPDVPILVAAVDQKLNENGYIVPGLGDAGDRIFGT